MNPSVETVLAMLGALGVIAAALAQYRRSVVQSETSARRRFYAAFARDVEVAVDDDNGWRPPTLTRRTAHASPLEPPPASAAMLSGEEIDDAAMPTSEIASVRLTGETGPNSRDIPTRWRAHARHTAFALRGRATFTPRGRNNDDDGDTFRRHIDESGDDAARSLFADLTVRAICAELFAQYEAQALRVENDGTVEMELLARGYDVDDARVKVLAVASLLDAMLAAAPAAAFPAELPSIADANHVHVASGANTGSPVAVVALDDSQGPS